MSRKKAKPAKASTYDLGDEIRRLQKIEALLIAVHYAANEDVEFDVSDALAAILVMVEQSLDGFDHLELAT